MENTQTSLIEIVKKSCEESFFRLKTIYKKNQCQFNYATLKFRALVFNDLDTKLYLFKFTFSEVYEKFLEIYFEKYEYKLHEYYGS